MATPMLDQSSPAPVAGASWGGGLGCPCVNPGDYFDVAQTFTAGRTGVLTGVDIFINASVGLGFVESDLLFDIRPTVGGLPLAANASALFSSQISKDSVPNIETQFFFVDLASAHINVSVGEQLAIVLRSEGGNYGFGGQPNSPYRGGGIYGRNVLSNPAWSGDFDPFNGDLAFRTYVEDGLQPVPERGTLWLLTAAVPLYLLWRALSR